MVRERKGNRDPLADELRWYFSDGDLSASSSFGGFVVMAMTGIQQGAKDNGVERRAVSIADGSDVGRHRGIRRRLVALTEKDPRHVDVLYAAYGPHDWPHVIDAAFGKGMGERFKRALGEEHIGPALMTARLAEMHREAVGEVVPATEPTMEAVDGTYRELDDDLRDRVVEKIRAAYPDAVPARDLDGVEIAASLPHSLSVAPLRLSSRLANAELNATEVSGAALDKVAAKYRLRRGVRHTRRMVATGAKPVEKAVPTMGALLASLVAAAYPEKAPKGGKKRLAAEAALRKAREVAGEAAMLLTQARMAMPEEEHHGGPRRATARYGATGGRMKGRKAAEIALPRRPRLIYAAGGEV